MRAAILLICALFVAGILAQNECSKISESCAKNGAACDLGSYNSGTDTFSRIDCPDGQYCKPSGTGTAGTCTSKVAVGGDCSSNVCAIGSACNVTMSPPTCVAITVVGSGASCDSFHECQTNLYCNGTLLSAGFCLAAVASGGDCSTTPYCVPGSFCDGGKCVASFSKNNGDSCISDYECPVGSQCGLTDGKCAAGTKGSGNTCANSTDTSCGSGQFCFFDHCNSKTPVYTCQGFPGNTNDEKKKLQAFWSCQNSHTSDVCDYKIGGSSCTNCKSQACAVGELNTKVCGFGDCNSAASLVASAVLLVAALFVAM